MPTKANEFEGVRKRHADNAHVKYFYKSYD